MAGKQESYALFGQDDGRLMLIDVTNGECVNLFEDGHTDSILALEADWGCMQAISCGSDGGVYHWDLEQGIGQNLADDCDPCVCARAISVNWIPKRTQREIDKQLLLEDLDLSKTSPSRMATKNFNRSGTNLLSRKSVDSNTAMMASRGFRRASTSPMRHSVQFLSEYLPVAPAPQEDTKALTGTDDGRLWLFNVTEGYLEKTYDFRLRLITALAMDWKKRRVLVGHGDCGLDLIDLEKAATLLTFQGHSCLLAAVCVNWPKGVALCGSGDGTLALWDVRRGNQVRMLKGHTGGITAAKLHTPSMRAVTGSADYSLRLWNVRQGACLQVFSQHDKPICSLSVDWDAGRLISAASAGAVLLWNIADGGQEPQEIKLSKAATGQSAPLVSLRPLPAASDKAEASE